MKAKVRTPYIKSTKQLADFTEAPPNVTSHFFVPSWYVALV